MKHDCEKHKYQSDYVPCHYCNPVPEADSRSAPCSEGKWTPEESAKYELVKIEAGHVFAWRKADNQSSQYLSCVVCRQPYHVIFPPNAEVSHPTKED